MTWIGVKERMPEDGQWIVAGNDTDSISFQDSCWVGRFFSGNIETKEFSVNFAAEFTHWQSLPEPPAEDQMQKLVAKPAELEWVLRELKRGKEQIWKPCGCYTTQSCECESPPRSHQPRGIYWEPDKRFRVYYAGRVMEWEDFRKANEPEHQYAEC